MFKRDGRVQFGRALLAGARSILLKVEKIPRFAIHPLANLVAEDGPIDERLARPQPSGS